MDHSTHTINHTYTVEIRFSGENLEPSEITRLLNINPSTSWESSDPMRAGRNVIPLWGYNGHDCEGFQPEWTSLDEGLRFVVQRLSPFRTKIVELAQRFDGVWWCGHFQSSFDGGPTLASEVLAQVSGFGLPLFIDNYFSDELPQVTR